MQAIRAQVVVPQASQQAAKARTVVPAAVVRPLKALGAGVASLALALSANAATVKMGADSGGLGWGDGICAAGRIALARAPRETPRCRWWHRGAARARWCGGRGRMHDSLPHLPAGALVFEPSSITISKGESVTFVNNAGFPHNVVFDEDAVPVSAAPGAASQLCCCVLLCCWLAGCAQLKEQHGQQRQLCLMAPPPARSVHASAASPVRPAQPHTVAINQPFHRSVPAGRRERRLHQPRRLLQRPRRVVEREAGCRRHLRLLLRAPPGRGHGR